jgi:hypothetical protein
MAIRRDSRQDPLANRMLNDPFFNSEPETDVHQVQASDLLDEVVDELGDGEEYNEEATNVFTEDQVRGFMDEAVLDDDIEEVDEDEEHTAIFDPHAHAPRPEAAAPQRTTATSSQPAAYTASAPQVFASQPTPKTRSQAPAPARQTGSGPVAPARPRQVSSAVAGVAPVQSGSSPSISMPVPRQRTIEQPAARHAYQEEATVVTDGAAFRAAAERVNPSLAPVRPAAAAPRVSAAAGAGNQQVVAAPVAAPVQRSGWSPVQLILGVILVLSLVSVAVLGWQLSRTQPPAEVAARGILVVNSTPTGATVRIGNEARGTTPAVISDLSLTEPLALVIELPGYATATEVVTLTGALTEREFALQAEVGQLLVTTVPPGAQVFLNGEDKGAAPQTIEGLDRSRTWTATATLDGHVPASQTVRWEAGSPADQNVVLVLTPLAPPVAAVEGSAALEASGAVATAPPEVVAPTPVAAPAAEPAVRQVATAPARPAAEPAATPLRERPAARPSAERPSAAATAAPADTNPRRERPSARQTEPAAAAAPPATEGGTATISVQAVPYGQVWIDGRMVARETPLLNHTLDAGTHRVKVYFESLRQFSDERTIRLEAGASQSVTFRAPR